MTYLKRRTVLRAGLAAAGATLLAACSPDTDGTQVVTTDGHEVRAAEARRRAGPTRELTLNAVAATVDLGGVLVNTWTYGGIIPGTPVRVKAGEILAPTIHNGLPAETSVHWHGLALRNDADGVPALTQQPIGSQQQASYRFAVPTPGTYWLHPHVGTQLDRGLYAPLIVEDPSEPLSYDDEWLIVLDDWLDGINGTPDDVLADLSKGMG